MGKQKGKGRNVSTVLVIIIAILALTGAISYVFAYEPYFKSERDRLLTFTTDLEPTHLDPANSSDTDSNSIILNVFDRMVQYKKGSTEIEPSLATSWEVLDPKTYIFHLRDDVKFHDGTPCNASSVKFSFERSLELDGPTAYILYVIENIDIIDAYTVKITLFEDFTPFIQVMAHPAASIVSQTAVEKLGDSFDYNPVGTGPFKFDNWDEEELVLTANNEYFKGAPHFQKLVFKIILEASNREKQLKDGNLDAVFTCPPGVPVEDLDALEANPDVSVIGGAGSDIEFLGLNTFIEPFNDLRVRQAIAYAIDYDKIINDVMGGRASRITGTVPPNIFGYTNITIIEQDISKARQLLSDAGYADGFDVELIYNIDNLARKEIADVIESSLAKIGIDVRVIGLDWDDLLDAYWAFDFEMTLNKWYPDYFDADSYLMPQFHSSSMDTAFNIWGFSNARVDELIEQARSTTSTEIRNQAYAEAQQIIADELPVINLFVPDLYDVVRYNVGGWEYTPTGFVYAYDLYRR